jgi:sugar/nucleoside kinase (ribokinase family)
VVTAFGVVGDLSLDIVVAQSGPRREGSDVPAKIRIGPGGQAANVAVRLARLGAGAALVAPLADDAAGRLLSGRSWPSTSRCGPCPPRGRPR